MANSSGDVMMTSGSIWKHIVKFSIPLAIGYLFQQLYTTVDSVVVGQFVGKEALAAIGTTTPIINTLIGFFTGLATGAGVVISKNYGAQNNEEVEKAVHTSILVTFILSIFATFIGVFTVPYMLGFMSTPEDVFGEATEYLVIYFWGIASLIIYNMGSAILRAVGDSKRPLYYLICSSVINVVFDLIFVVNMNLGVAGAAYATVLSQIVSAILVLISLSVSKGMYKLEWKRLSVDKDTLKEILRIGMPTALQQSLTSFSNVFVQSYINAFGSSVMAGWSSYTKIDQFVVIPVNSLSMSITTFVGQNLGAGEVKRSEKGTLIANIIAFATTETIAIVLVIFAPYFIMLFNSDPEVVENGAFLLKIMTPFYTVWGISMVISGALCGAGDTRTATAVKFFSFVIFRQIYLFIITKFTDTLFWVVISYPIGWGISALLISWYYIKKKQEIAMRFSQ